MANETMNYGIKSPWLSSHGDFLLYEEIHDRKGWLPVLYINELQK